MIATAALFLLLQTGTTTAAPATQTAAPRHDHSAMAAQAMAAQSSSEDDSNTVELNISFAAKEFVEVADAMPESRYSFAPTTGEFKGVRNFGEQVTHVADANIAFAHAVLNNKKAPPDAFKKPTSKADIVAYVRDSFDLLQKAAASLTAQNATERIINPFGGDKAPYGGKPDRIGILMLAAAHSRDHYGQLAVYLRMSNIIPPASRPK